jgi:osmotically-inducible protein OsmY
MKLWALIGCAALLLGPAIAQQPSPMGSVNDSGKNYRLPDGTTLSKNPSDEDLTRALYERYASDPELTNIQVKVHHRRVTLAGVVLSKDFKSRAEKLALNTAGVRDVNNKLKVGVPHPQARESILSASH